MHTTWLVLLVGVCFCIMVLGVTANGIPPKPCEFYGGVTINGQPAPAGTLIEARINGQLAGALTTTAAGTYGGTGAFDHRLIVNARESGPTILFFINGEPANQTAIFHDSSSQRLDLALVTAVGSSAFNLSSDSSPAANVTPATTTPVSSAPHLASYEQVTLSIRQTEVTPGTPKAAGTTQLPQSTLVETTSSLPATQPPAAETTPENPGTSTPLTPPATSPAGPELPSPTATPGFIAPGAVATLIVFFGGWHLLRK